MLRLIGITFLLLVAAYSPISSSSSFESQPRIRLPESMTAQIVGENIQIHGLNASVLQFQSYESIAQLTEFFSGLWPGSMKRRRAGEWHVLAHPEAGALITIQMRALDPSGVQGYIAITDIFSALQAQRVAPKITLPMLAGTQVLQDLRANDQGRESRTLMLLSDRSVHENLEFYRAHYKAEGYEPSSHRALFRGDASGVMLLNRGAEQINLTVAGRGDITLITIVNIRN